MFRRKLTVTLDGMTRAVSAHRELAFRAVNPHDRAVADMLVIDLEHFYGHEHFEVVDEATGETTPPRRGAPGRRGARPPQRRRARGGPRGRRRPCAANGHPDDAAPTRRPARSRGDDDRPGRRPRRQRRGPGGARPRRRRHPRGGGAALRLQVAARRDPRDDAAPRRIEPHHLVLHAGRWYLLGYDAARSRWQVLRADRLRPCAHTGRRSRRGPCPGATPPATSPDG